MIIIKTSKNINKLLSIIIVLVFIFGLIFITLFIKNNVIVDSDTKNSVSVGSLDASNESTVSKSKLYKDYNGDKFILSIDKSGNYTLLSNDMSYQFTGKYQYQRGKSVLSYISAPELQKIGLNKNKINLNNLYIIKADYDKHIFKYGIEYFNPKTHDSSDNAFYFLIYFKENSNKEILSAVHFVGDISQVNFSSSNF